MERATIRNGGDDRMDEKGKAEEGRRRHDRDNRARRSLPIPIPITPEYFHFLIVLGRNRHNSTPYPQYP